MSAGYRNDGRETRGSQPGGSRRRRACAESRPDCPARRRQPPLRRGSRPTIPADHGGDQAPGRMGGLRQTVWAASCGPRFSRFPGALGVSSMSARVENDRIGPSQPGKSVRATFLAERRGRSRTVPGRRAGRYPSRGRCDDAGNHRRARSPGRNFATASRAAATRSGFWRCVTSGNFCSSSRASSFAGRRRRHIHG